MNSLEIKVKLIKGTEILSLRSSPAGWIVDIYVRNGLFLLINSLEKVKRNVFIEDERYDTVDGKVYYSLQCSSDTVYLSDMANRGKDLRDAFSVISFPVSKVSDLINELKAVQLERDLT